MKAWLLSMLGGAAMVPVTVAFAVTIALNCLSDDAAATAHRMILAGLMALLVMSVAFVPSLIGGVRLVEARHATNRGGKQAAWSLFYIALPITLAMGATAFFVTWRTIS